MGKVKVPRASPMTDIKNDMYEATWNCRRRRRYEKVAQSEIFGTRQVCRVICPYLGGNYDTG